MKIVAIGRTEFLYEAIIALNEEGNDILLIITDEAAPEYQKEAYDFKKLAESLGIECIITNNIQEDHIKLKIKTLNSDVAVSVNWKTIINQNIINCFKYGIINAHAGDLPRYRGNAVTNWAIINSEKYIVITLHQMSEKLDAGPILLKKRKEISNDTKIGEIHQFLRESIPKLFVDVINGLVNGSIIPMEQPKDPSLSLRCYPRMPRDGLIVWTKSAEEIDKLIRAVSEPFSGAYTYIDNIRLIIWKARTEIPQFCYLGIPGQVANRNLNSGEVTVVTGNNFLVIEELELVGSGTRSKPTEVIKSIRTRLGMDVYSEIEKLYQKIASIETEMNSKNMIR